MTHSITKRNNLVECICEICGNVFHEYPSGIKEGRGKYCSMKCHRASHRVTRICEQCHNPFSVMKCRVETGVTKYCSRKCRDIAVNTKVEIKCHCCGKEFLVSPSRFKRGDVQFCSTECRSKEMVREKHHAWRGGNKKKERGENWGRQKKLVFDRDKGICQYCNRIPKRSERKFHVHHIQPYETFNGNYIMANQLSNLTTLCPKCHKRAELGKVPIQRPLL